MLSRSLRSAADQASWTALGLLPRPWGGGQGRGEVTVPGAVSPGQAGTRRDASTSFTASKPEDAQVLLAALQRVFLSGEGRCWSLPSVVLEG